MPNNNVIPVAMRAGPILALMPSVSTVWATTALECGTASFRMAELAHLLLARLAARLDADRPRLVLIECPFGRASCNSEPPLILAGTAPVLAQQRGIAQHELGPSTILELVAGSGPTNKRDLLPAGASRGWAPDTDHVAEAAALIKAALAQAVQGAAP